MSAFTPSTIAAIIIAASFAAGLNVYATVLTLGLFYLVVNGLAFALAAWLVPGFTVASLGSAIGGALVVSIISSLLGWILTPRPRDVP